MNNDLLFCTNRIGQLNLTFPNMNSGSLFKPLCLQLKDNKSITTVDGLPIQKCQLTNNTISAPQGLLSLFKNEKYKIQIAICVTIFKEKLPDMESTLKGISSNFEDFIKIGIYPHQIAVFVVFDGISHVYNEQQEFSSYHNNIISFFQQIIDKRFDIEEEDSLQSHYNHYRRLEEHFNEFSPQKLEKVKQNNLLLVKLIKKYERDLTKLGINQEDIYKQDQAFNAFRKLYDNAKKELQDKKNKAWVYQIQHKMPIFFVFKYANGRKLSSHNWFFGFCEELQPEYVILLDVGCVPQKGSLVSLIKELKNPSGKIGGVCGTMRIKLEKESYSYDINSISILMAKIFSIQRCQQCEYDLGHILDKQYESLLDYVHVLPGAFSAYLYKALKKNEVTQIDPLEIYLKSQREGGENFKDIEEANMYLAEDRVLCAQLYFNGYYLRYVPESEAEVDPMLNLIDLMLQRRRWINGSWFALNKVVNDFKEQRQLPIEQNQNGNQDGKRRIIKGADLNLFTLSLVFAQIGQITQYFYQTFQIVWIYMIMKTIVITGSMWSDFLVISLVIGIYLILIISLILLSLSYDPSSIDAISKMQKKEQQGQVAQELKNWYFDNFYLISTILGIFNYVVIVYTIYLLINDIILGDKQFSFIYDSSLPQNYYILLIIISFGTNALPFLFGLTNPKMICSILRNLPAYLFYQPTYNNVYVIYSFCRIDDLSWGTKGLTMDTSSNITIDKQYSKFIFIMQWLLSNIISSTIIFLILNLSFYLLFQSIVLAIGVLLTLLSILKGIFALSFQMRNYCFLEGQRKKIVQNNKSDYNENFFRDILKQLQIN